jgi:hypothetical protein
MKKNQLSVGALYETESGEYRGYTMVPTFICVGNSYTTLPESFPLSTVDKMIPSACSRDIACELVAFSEHENRSNAAPIEIDRTVHKLKRFTYVIFLNQYKPFNFKQTAANGRRYAAPCRKNCAAMPPRQVTV